MDILLVVSTYAGYIFIVTMYTVKIVRYLRLPLHLRSEIYPIRKGRRNSQEHSYFENLEWWNKPVKGDFLGKTFFLLREYFLLSEYFYWDRGYWLFLYLWHIGFISIILFHILSFIGALSELLGFPVLSSSTHVIGIALYFGSLFVGGLSFIAGLVGGIGIFLHRIADKDLRAYATPMNYLTYSLLLLVFLSGLCAWIFDDRTFHGYRFFWAGVITLRPVNVAAFTAVHILLFTLLLVYLPFTRSLHYVTRFFAFFLMRWDDKPNFRESGLEKAIETLQHQNVTWMAPHVQSGKSWKEICAGSVRPQQKGLKQ